VNAVLVISARDNVATALEVLEAGRTIAVDGVTFTICRRIPRGHKVALRAIRAGDPVVKYGHPIGAASVDIAPGDHVHIHNVSSGRGRGDLSLPPSAAAARLAEPADPVDPVDPVNYDAIDPLAREPV